MGNPARESGVVVGVSGWSWLGVRVVHPGLFLGVVLLATEVQARPQPRESDLLELPGEVPEGFGDGRQGGSFSDHGFILDLGRSEEHTSELQSRLHLVCRLLL